MASQRGSRFSSPMFNQNFPPNSFNFNSGMNRIPRPQFQKSTTPRETFQSSERFDHRFQNRHQFSNFPDACGFLNRPPPSLPPSHNVQHSPPQGGFNSYPGPLNSPSGQHFPSLSNPSASHPPFPSQPSAQSHQSFSNHPPIPPPLPQHSPVPSHPPPSHSQPNFSSPPSFSSHQLPVQYNQLPNMSCPPQRNQLPNMSHPPQPNQLSSVSCPPQSNQFPNMSRPPQPNQLSDMSHPLQLNQHSGLSRPLQHIQLPDMSRPFPQNQHSSTSYPSQHNQLQNTSHLPQHNQFPSMSHSHHQHQRFRLQSPNLSPSRAPRPQFDNSFQRSYKPWNQMTRFGGPGTPFSSRSPNVVKYPQFKDASQPANKKKKLKSREFRKLKDDSTEKPYSCDTCDRAFITKNELNDHSSQHIKCNYESCTFEAHPKIVLLHKKMQHETGYAERISKLKDDAEVKKWREERRKRFPTAENIRKRKAEQAEKIARGEVLETKEFGKFKRRTEENKDLANGPRKRMRGHHGRRNRFRRNFYEQRPNSQYIKVNSESDSDSDSHISLNMFSGLQSLANPDEEVHQPNEMVEINYSEQNLPKSISNIDENHLNVSLSENNLADSSTKVLSDAEPIENANPEDESVLEIPDDEIEKPKKELIVVEDSDDEGPEVITINKSQEKNCVATNSDDEGPDVLAASKNQDESCIAANSDDEGPDVLAISKNQDESSIAANSDDEGPDVFAASKNQDESCIAANSDNEVPDVLAISKNQDESCIAANSDDEGPEVIPIKKYQEQICVTGKEKKDRFNVNDASEVSKLNCKDIKGGSQSRKHGPKRENNLPPKQYATNQVRKHSLLEKLLADDIRHERNVVLQCVRHIVNNNFFGLGVKKS